MNSEFYSKIYQDLDDIEQNFILLGDQLKLHTSEHVTEVSEAYGSDFTHNVIAWPDGNAIENFFSVVKNNYKRLRL